MDYIYGKLNEKVKLTEYRGLSTDTSTVIVDNANKTIRVDFTGSIISSAGGGKIASVSVNGNKLTIDDNKNVDISIPYATSQLANDAKFVDAAVDNLINYYLKTEVYNQDEINYKLDDIRNLIYSINVQGVKFEVIDTLPDWGEPNAIYLLNTPNGGYTQWVFVNNSWLEITTEVDLTHYVTDAELEEALNGLASSEIINQKVQEAMEQLTALIPTNLSQLNNDINFVTAEYVEQNGGKIDNIYVNGELQAIENKAVNITIPESNGFNDVVIQGEGNAITAASYNAETKILTLDKDATFLTEHQSLEDYAKKDSVIASTAMTIDPSTYVITLSSKDANGNTIGTDSTVDLPLESVVVGGRYDDASKKVILTLDNDQTVEFSVADLVDGLQNAITADNKLNSDLVDDSTATNKFVTEQEKASWTNKQEAINETNLLDASFIDDTNSNNKFVTSAQKMHWDAKQEAITAEAKLSSDLIDDTNSSNKFITAEQANKLETLNADAQKNVQSDWSITDTTSDAFILNKPTKLSDFENDLNINVDLTNYYTKDQIYTKEETYTKSEIEALIQSSIENNIEATINDIMEGSY